MTATVTTTRRYGCTGGGGRVVNFADTPRTVVVCRARNMQDKGHSPPPPPPNRPETHRKPLGPAEILHQPPPKSTISAASVCGKFHGSPWILCGKFRGQFETRHFPHGIYCPPPLPLCRSHPLDRSHPPGGGGAREMRLFRGCGTWRGSCKGRPNSHWVWPRGLLGDTWEGGGGILWGPRDQRTFPQANSGIYESR